MNTSDHWQRVEELFHGALKLPPEARVQFLTEACGGAEALRAQVAALLAAHESVEDAPLEVRVSAIADGWLTAAQRESLAGRTIRQYQVLDKLGQGGMGEVYLAYDSRLCRQVALKRLLAQAGFQSQAKQRFLREARAAARLDHPNVCAIYEVFEEEAECLIVMQYIEGETLAARLQRGSCTVAEALAITVQIAAALAAAHQAGVIHRDIKPHNLMLSAQGQVKVLDFGIAKLLEQAETAVSPPAITTNPAQILGTPNYMSPEQARGETVDARSDLFCLGVVLYEMLTGQAPFDAPSTSEVLANLLKTEPPPLRSLLPTATAELEAVLQKALAKQPAARYQTAQELLDDLQRLSAKRPVVAGKPAVARRAQVRPVLYAATLAGILLLVLAAWWGFKRGPAIHDKLDSIAVLPFSQTEGQADTDYLATGLTEELINELTKVSELRVAPRSSVFGIQDKSLGLPQVAEQLQVKVLLTGRLMVRDGQIELQAELIEAARQAQLWGQRFSRPVAELQSLRQEVTSAVLQQLGPGRRVSPRAKQHQTSATAYDAYLKGVYALRQRLRGESGQRSPRTVKLLNEAVKLDQHYAPTWAALAAAYALLTTDGLMSPREGAGKAKDAALKALSLDNALPEAHLALADIYFYTDWNFTEAAREYRRYIELSPHDAQPWRTYARFLSYRRNFVEAEQALAQARRLEPFVYANELAWADFLNDSRQYKRTIEHCLEAIKLYPRQLGLKVELAIAYLNTGRFEQALHLREQITAANPTTFHLTQLAIYRAATGDRAGAFALIARKDAQRAAAGTVSYRHPIGLARLHAMLGEKEEALKYLEQGYQQRIVAMVSLHTDFAYNKLRDDPRFQDLLRRIGL